MVPLVVVLASTAASGGGTSLDLTSLFQYGVLGVVVVCFIFGTIVPGWLYKQVKEERDEYRMANDSLRTRIEDTILPQSIKAAEVLGRALDKEKHSQ